MKKLIIAVAIAASISNASADTTVSNVQNTRTVTIHSDSIVYGFNKHDVVQVDSLVTMVHKGKLTRIKFAVTGCIEATGVIVTLSPSTGKSEGEPYLWTGTGGSVMDGVAAGICAEAEVKAGKDLEQAKKVNAKTSI